jgi:hypothetical protein
MIRVRSERGKPAVEVPKSAAVEVVDQQGKLALLILDRGDNGIHVVTAGDMLFNAYCRANSLYPSRVTVHEPPTMGAPA